MNYRDKSKDGEFAGKGLVGALVLGGAALTGKAISNAVSNSKKNAQLQERNKQIQKINSQIADIDRQINNYKSELLGSWLNDDKITQLERQRKQLIEERRKYE